MLKRFLFVVLMWVSLSYATFGQSTTVSGTITDRGSQAWANGTYLIQFNPNGAAPPYQWNGSPFVPGSHVFSGKLNNSGAFSGLSIPSNTSIAPGTLWAFTVCPAATSPCYSTSISITGATQSVTASIVPPTIIVTANTYNQPTAYSDLEIVGPSVGFTYFNLTDQTNHTCTVAIPCTWVAGGGSGSGNVSAAGTLANNAIVTGAGSKNVQTPNASATMDSSGDVSLPGTMTAVGYGATGSNSGYVYLGQGTDNCVAAQPANSVCWEAPTSVGTSYHGLFAATPSAGIPHYAYSAPTITETISAVVGADMTSHTVTATQLAAQYSVGSCTELWGGSGTSFALTSGDDAIANNSCYNDSGVTRTITAVKCRSDNGSNTTTVNPTFGSAGTGTTILSGALTCGNSLAYSSSGTVSNASWTTGTGITPAMSGTLTGTSIAMIVEYTF